VVFGGGWGLAVCVVLLGLEGLTRHKGFGNWAENGDVVVMVVL